MPCFFRIISETLLEIHTMDKCDFLKALINSQIFLFSMIVVTPSSVIGGELLLSKCCFYKPSNLQSFHPLPKPIYFYFVCTQSLQRGG